MPLAPKKNFVFIVVECVVRGLIIERLPGLSHASQERNKTQLTIKIFVLSVVAGGQLGSRQLCGCHC